MIRILVADDHPLIRAGIRHILSQSGDILIADEAESGQEALSKVFSSDFDVIVMDISMPGIGGLEAVKELRCLKPNLPVLVLSVHREEEYAIRAIKAGASGYMRKVSAPEELIGAIRKLHQGGKYITTSLAEELAEAMQNKSKKAPHQLLSNREYQVLRLIAQGLKTREIGEELSLSPSTVSTYRTRILSKMDMKSIVGLTHYAIKHNLLEETS